MRFSPDLPAPGSHASTPEVGEDRDAFVARISRRRYLTPPVALPWRMPPGVLAQASSRDTMFRSDREAVICLDTSRDDHPPDLDPPSGVKRSRARSRGTDAIRRTVDAIPGLVPRRAGCIGPGRLFLRRILVGVSRVTGAGRRSPTSEPDPAYAGEGNG